MHIYIFANAADHSIKLVEKDLIGRSIPFSKYRFRDLSIVSNNLYLNGKKFVPKTTDRILMRSPWNTPYFTQDYTTLARFISETYKSQLVFDRESYLKHLPFYQDKLYQGLLYKSLKIRTPNVWYFESEKRINIDAIPMPIVLKHRTSARSRNNYLIKTKKELGAYISNIPLKKWYFQEYIDAKRDIRINVLKGKVLYAYERTVRILDKNRLTVNGDKLLTSIPSIILNNALSIAKYLGADLIGIDFLESISGKYYLIEVNLSPQLHITPSSKLQAYISTVVDEIVK